MCVCVYVCMCVVCVCVCVCVRACSVCVCVCLYVCVYVCVVCVCMWASMRVYMCVEKLTGDVALTLPPWYARPIATPPAKHPLLSLTACVCVLCKCYQSSDRLRRRGVTAT